MKNITEKIKKYLNDKSVFLSWFFIVLSVDYIFLFSLEIILPGFVTAFLNLNILLLLIILIWVVLSLLVKNENKKEFLNGWVFKIILPSLFLVVLVSLFFVLYKAKYQEIIPYFIFIFLVGKYFYDYLKQEFISHNR